jgi:DNA-binding NarL/FixJ family response regulator
MPPDQAIRLALAAQDGDSAAPAAVAGPPAGHDLERLSRRELQVCGLIAEGRTNRQIGQALSISERTVGSHVDHIMTKLNARSRTRIAVWAVEHGLGHPTGTEVRPSG